MKPKRPEPPPRLDETNTVVLKKQIVSRLRKRSGKRKELPGAPSGA